MIRHILFWNYTEKVKEEHYTGGIPSFYAAVSGYDEWKYRGTFCMQR